MNNDILKIYEFKENVITNINNSNLPAVIIKYVLKDLVNEIEQIEIKQFEELKAQQNNLKEKEEENG